MSLLGRNELELRAREPPGMAELVVRRPHREAPAAGDERRRLVQAVHQRIPVYERLGRGLDLLLDRCLWHFPWIDASGTFETTMSFPVRSIAAANSLLVALHPAASPETSDYRTPGRQRGEGDGRTAAERARTSQWQC